MKKAKLALLEVAAEQVAHLTDDELHGLMARLFAAEAALVGMSSSSAVVCSDTNITDAGQDGRTEAHGGTSAYLPSVATCWQFKAGGEGTPAGLEGEVTKPLPAETLKNGGAYVVVTSAAKGPTLLKRRLDVLVQEAKRAHLPTKNIAVIEAEILAKWCTERLGVALHVLGASPFCLTPELWRKGSKLLSGTYVADEPIRKDLAQVREALDPSSGSVFHVHVQGLPGVGKTRFALEAVDGSPWKDLAVCFDGTDNARAIELLAHLGLDKSRHGIVVVDEAQADEIDGLNAAVQRCDGRVRLITIGTARLSGGREKVAIALSRLNDVEMAKVIAERHPRLTNEQVDFCAHQAGGYVKFADVLADAVERNPGVSVTDIFDDDHVTDSLTRLLHGLDGAKRRALSIVALFSSIGWKSDAENELKAVAKHFGLTIADFRQAADAAHKRFGICPTAGRRRYVSPDPLANYLATEAWRSEEEAVAKLPGVLGGTPALDAFYDRLKRLATFPAAKSFAQRELDRFFDLTTLNSERAARVWSIVSAADPVRAVANLRRALEAPGADLLGFRGRPRREVVWALERLAWPRACFQDAIWCLALLALAENETYANNATGTFLQRFMPVLAGTEVPFLERLPVLDELLQVRSAATQGLVLRAFDATLTTSAHRMGIEEVDGRPLPPEWAPTRAEFSECRRVAIARIRALVNDGVDELRTELFRVFKENFWPMAHEGLLQEMADFARAIIERFPDGREEVRRSIASTIDLLARTGRDRALKGQIETLEAEFVDQSFAGRLKKFIGNPAYNVHEPTDDVRALAREACADPSHLDANKDWLRSNDARGGWLLGVALAEIDSRERMLKQLVALAGRGEGGPMLSAYLMRRAKDHDNEWLEDVLDQLAAGTPEEEELSLDVTARTPGSERGAVRMKGMVERHRVPERRFASLAFGPWPLEVPAAALSALIMSFPRSETFSLAGAAMLGSRAGRDDPEATASLEPLLLNYATRVEVIRSRSQVEYQWQLMARALLPAHAREISAAIFACQLPHEDWFIEHSGAGEVLGQCVDADPAGVWDALVPHLESDEAALFVIGFPDFVVPRMPAGDVLAWIAVDPERRGVTIARLLPGVADDASLGARIADRFGHIRGVSGALFSSLISGGFWGPASQRWKEEALAMDKVAAETKLDGTRRWARGAADSLRRMAEQERGREAEEEVRR